MVGVLRRGSAARMDYIRRFVAVMLALVLCMGLIRPPRAQAAPAAPAIAATAAVNPLAALGVMLIALAGVAVAQEAISSGVVGSAVYDEGQKLMAALAVDPECSAWYRTQQVLMDTGLKPGTKIEVPAHVMKAAREWVGETYDFSSGPVVTTQNGFFDADRFVSFGHYPNLTGDWMAASFVPTLFFKGDSLIFPSSAFLQISKYDIRILSSSGTTFARFLTTLEDPYSCFLNYTGTVVVIGLYHPSRGICTNFTSRDGVSLSELGLSLLSATGTLSKTPELDVLLEVDQTMTVPKDIPTTLVDGVTVPVITTMDRDMILEGAEPIDPPIVTNPPIVEDQTMVGDVALEDVAAQQESLGAVFVSKFPFCIPWDMYNAVKLLAAPAKTPYWEVDFLAPISSRVGGWRGNTKVVIDMGEYEIIGQLCRWVSTILFCATLISGTKKLIWTG